MPWGIFKVLWSIGIETAEINETEMREKRCQSSCFRLCRWVSGNLSHTLMLAQTVRNHCLSFCRWTQLAKTLSVSISWLSLLPSLPLLVTIKSVLLQFYTNVLIERHFCPKMTEIMFLSHVRHLFQDSDYLVNDQMFSFASICVCHYSKVTSLNAKMCNFIYIKQTEAVVSHIWEYGSSKC